MPPSEPAGPARTRCPSSAGNRGSNSSPASRRQSWTRNEPRRTCIHQQFLLPSHSSCSMLREREALELILGRFDLNQCGAKFFRRAIFLSTAREVVVFRRIVADAIQMITTELAHRPEGEQVARSIRLADDRDPRAR